MERFAREYFGYNNEKELDFLTRFNGKYIIGEAKFLTDFGGHQDAQFADAISTITSTLLPNRFHTDVIKIAICNGVLFIKGNNKMHKHLINHEDQIVISSLLLREFLYSLYGRSKMELIFNNKRPITDIMTDVESCNTSTNFIMGKSFLYQGDNYVGMAELLKSHKGFIDLVYIDPPFNTNQIFSVGENRTSTISRKKNDKVAYSDLMDTDSFLKMMYERFVLIKELLSEKGSLYVHIDTKMGHYFKVILDEIFGKECYKNDITRIKSNPKNFDRKAYGNQKDMILFYSKNPSKNIWNEIKEPLDDSEIESKFPKIEPDGRRYTTVPLHAPGESKGITGQSWRGMMPPEGRHWRTSPEEFEKMDAEGLIEWSSTGNPRIKKYADEHKGKKIQDIWSFKDPQYPIYPTQKNQDMIELIIKQSSTVNGYVMDCFAGSGSTLMAAISTGRKFIGMDMSDVSIGIIKERLKDIEFVFEEK